MSASISPSTGPSHSGAADSSSSNTGISASSGDRDARVARPVTRPPILRRPPARRARSGGEGLPTGAERVVARDRRTWLDGWRVPAVAGLLTALALVATFTSHPDFYIADSRFEHYWSSLDFLRGHGYLWESTNGFGAPEAFYSPVVAAWLALLDVLGFAPAAAERLFHSAALVVAGLGVLQVVRLFRPGRGVEALVAALIYSFNPYSAQFLLPSNLFMSYVVAPWLMVAAVRGSRGERPWRWAAVFALAVFAVGSVNPASLGFAFIPTVSAVVYLCAVERSATPRSVIRWVGRAGVLTTLVSLPGVVQGSVNADLVVDALVSTERPRDIGRLSSWSESWRGLGFWLTYFSDAGGLVRSEAAGFFTRWWVVAATFVVPIGGTLTLWRSRWRARLLFAGMTLPALALMVGVFPPDRPAPLGRLLEDGYGISDLGLAFRTGYKAGPALVLGLGALFAVGATALVRRLGGSSRRPRVVRGAAVALLVAALLVSSFPFWTGRLYSDREQLGAIPAYWRSALTWLDRRPDDGRVLILPGTDRTRYRWGYAGDDIFDALLERSHVQPSALWRGTAESADLLDAIDERIAGRSYLPGSLAPIARRTGVRWVLVRNDLNWQRAELPRPADLGALRADPDLRRVTTFGFPGENVVAPGTDGGVRADELALPPVEIFEVRGAGPELRVAATSAPLIVAGSGDSWPRLARSGFLDDGRPIAYSGDLSGGQLRDALEAGAPLVVTDGARRRSVHISAEHIYRSHALAPGELAERGAASLFDAPGAQGRATGVDAVRIEASSYGRWYRSFDRWARPASAFDGEESTAWRVDAAAGPVGQWLRVVLREPHEVSLVELTLPTQEPGLSQATRATVRLSDGTHRSVDLADRVTAVSLPARSTTSIEVRIDAASGFGGGGAGFAEVRVPGLDLAEWIRVPDDVVRSAADPGTAELLTAADTTYLFERVVGEGPNDEETALRRMFRTAGTREYALSGEVQVTPTTPDRALDALVGGSMGAFGSARFAGFTDRRGGLAADGNPGTGWQVEPRPGERLTVRIPGTTVQTVDVLVAVRDAEGLGGAYSRPRELTVRIPGTGIEVRRSLVATAEAECDPLFLPGACLERHTVTFPGTATEAIEVEIGRVDPAVGLTGNVPVKIAEVTVTTADGATLLGASEAMRSECLDLFAVDGAAVAVRVDGSMDDLMSGRRVSFVACAPLTLDAGDHTLASLPTFPGIVDAVELRSGGTGSQGRDGVTVADAVVLDRSPTRARVKVDVPEGGAFLVSGQSFDPRWRATAGGRDLGKAQALDTFAAWHLPPGKQIVTIEYEPQRRYELAIAVASGAVVVCLVLAIERPRRRRRG